MNNHNINVFISVDELAEFAVSLLINKIAETSEGEFVTLALSGGSTPRQIFDYISSNDRGRINWGKVKFFFVDERCVPPDDAESNFGMSRHYLFENLEILDENIFRIFGENDPESEAIRYSSVICENVPMVDNFPRFHMVWLGLGDDGHTASIFPDNTRMFQSSRICEVALHPQSRQKRITLTGPVINNASEVIFMVTGSGKAEIVDRLLQQANTGLPASFVKPEDGKLIWLLDKDAAKLLHYL